MADSMRSAPPAVEDVVPSTGAAVPDGGAEEVPAPAASRRLEVVCAGVCLALAVTLYLGARGIQVRTETGGIDPRWWPQLLGLAGIALSTLMLLTALLRPPLQAEDLQTTTRVGRARLALALVASVALGVLWPLVGFVPAAAVFVAALTYLFGGRGWRTLVLFPALLTGFLHLVFAVLLEVPL